MVLSVCVQTGAGVGIAFTKENEQALGDEERQDASKAGIREDRRLSFLASGLS